MKNRKKKKEDVVHNNIFTTPTFKEDSYGKKSNQYNENSTWYKSLIASLSFLGK